MLYFFREKEPNATLGSGEFANFSCRILCNEGGKLIFAFVFKILGQLIFWLQEWDVPFKTQVSRKNRERCSSG